MQQSSSIVPIEQLLREPFIDILVYPSSSVEIARDRVKEIESIGVKGLVLEGNSIINGLHILGKGCTSIVVKAVLDKKSSVNSVSNDNNNNNNSSSNSSRSLEDVCDGMVVALKIMRTDSDRASMEHEARMLAIANGVGIGPRLIAYSMNLLAMELIDGMHMIEFVKEFGGSNGNSDGNSGGISSSKAKDREGNHNHYTNMGNCNNHAYVKYMLRDILEQCFLLDSIGLDHGELGRMDRHVIIGSKAYIIDFESSSMNRRVTNVTSAANYILFGKGRALADMLGLYRDKSRIVDALRMYRLDMCRDKFNQLLTLLGLKFYKESSACR